MKKLCVECKHYKAKAENFSSIPPFLNHHCTHPDAQDIVTGEFDLSCYDARQDDCLWFKCGVEGKYWEAK